MIKRSNKTEIPSRSRKSESTSSGSHTAGPAGAKMTNIPLSSKVSSLFDIPERRELHAHGSSITSFAWEPKDEDHRKSKKIVYENTYKMEPPEKFRPDRVKPLIQKVLSTNLEGRKYDPIECSILSKALADDIKMQVKELNFQRYKILSVITIGQKKDQGVRVGSRFLWDADRDSFCAVDWSNKHLYAVGEGLAIKAAEIIYKESRDMRFPTMLYVPPAMPQISLHTDSLIRAFGSR